MGLTPMSIMTEKEKKYYWRDLNSDHNIVLLKQSYYVKDKENNIYCIYWLGNEAIDAQKYLANRIKFNE